MICNRGFRGIHGNRGSNVSCSLEAIRGENGSRSRPFSHMNRTNRQTDSTVFAETAAFIAVFRENSSANTRFLFLSPQAQSGAIDLPSSLPNGVMASSEIESDRAGFAEFFFQTREQARDWRGAGVREVQ